MRSMLIVYRERPTPGWHPVNYMVRLMAELFEADLLVFGEADRPRMRKKLTALLPRRRGGESCIFVAAVPTDLDYLLSVEGWRSRFGQIVAWVIDSFWVEHLSALALARRVRAFDRIYITSEEEDLSTWSRLTRTPTDWLPWGSDVLRLGTGATARSVDLLRMGRQPAEWEDDAVTEAECSRCGLRFQGRPPLLEGMLDNQKSVMSAYARSKFVLAFSNRIAPAPYTHPRREYITGRWTDALACGATVAGVAPVDSATRKLLWPGATLELPGIARRAGLETLRAAVRDWSHAHALRNHRQALRRLDWRWRFEVLARELREPAPRLFAELDEIRRRDGELDRQDTG